MTTAIAFRVLNPMQAAQLYDEAAQQQGPGGSLPRVLMLITGASFCGNWGVFVGFEVFLRGPGCFGLSPNRSRIAVQRTAGAVSLCGSMVILKRDVQRLSLKYTLCIYPHVTSYMSSIERLPELLCFCRDRCVSAETGVFWCYPLL